MLKAALLIVAVALLVVLPLALRPGAAAAPSGARELIIITPHNEQIRSEFGLAFDRWHERQYGERVNVVYNVPGGTSEIRKMLLAQCESALRGGEPVGGNADLVFGGGSYEHQVLKEGVRVEVDGAERSASISAPLDFEQSWLDARYGQNQIGDAELYDPDQHWFGTALSGFGMVFNLELLAELGVPTPTTWTTLCDPRLRGWVALVNPGQSGSVTTALEAILQRRGWIEGWRVLRRAAGNARYFSASALKPPIDVSRGDAAIGICIDFYGRYQAQALKSATGAERLGYVDPPGETMIDPDPISLLNGAPHLELAKRFVEFCLSEEGQALWQFKVGDTGGDGLGPREFELRRMPIRRDMYERYFDRLIDQVNPYLIASPLETYHREYRAFITLLLTSLGIDNHELLAQAWSAIVTHPGYPSDPERIVTAQDVQDPILRQMLELFDQLPAVPGPEGRPRSLEEPGSLPEIKSGWLRGDWKEQGLWNEDEPSGEALRRLLTSRFRENYRKIIALGSASDG